MGALGGKDGRSKWAASDGGDLVRGAMARALCWLFAGGAALAALTIVLAPDMDRADRLLVAGSAAAAAGLCLVLRFGWRRLPGWSYHALLGAGAAIVTVGVYATRGQPGDMELFYVWIAIYAGYFFSRRGTLGHLGWIGALYAVVLPTTAGSPSYAVRWVITIGTLLVATLLVAALNDRLTRRLAERERSEGELERSLSLLRSTLESTTDGILVVDDRGSMLTFNARFQEMWRVPDEVLAARDDDSAMASVLDQLTSPDAFVAKVRELYDRPEAESYDVLEFKDGRVFERYSQPQRSTDGRVVGRVWSFRDVTERERVQAQLRHLADHDMLTGLLNRRRFEEELARHASRGRPRGGAGALLLLDLDDLKQINDTLGHHAGDGVISSVARLLRERLPEGEVLARMGGDEFAILLPDADAEAATASAGAILEAVRGHRVVTQGHHARVTTSVGVAPLDGRGALTAEELMARADLAMYDAKHAGRDRACLYDTTAHALGSPDARRHPADRIRAALEGGRLALYAQPVVELRSNAVAHLELLLRMNDEDGRTVPPGGFLPTAERSGMAPEIDAWVTRQAIRAIDEQRRAGRRLRLEVNLSPRTIATAELLAVLEEELALTEVDPASLIFEVTESAAISNMEHVREFSSGLARLGCGFALDDFGAGFGSFHYVKYLPLDYLKIDGGFVAELPHDPSDQAIVRAIVDLASRIGKRTIAEHVGDERTMEMLRGYGVDYAQGYHVGRPQPIAEVLASHGTGPSGPRE